MPICIINTNIAKVSPTLLKIVSETVAKCLSKPETNVMVQVNPNKMMCFSGKADPCAVMQIRSIGAIAKASNNAAAVVLNKLLAEQLGVDESRILIEFFDVNGENLALRGATLR